MRYSALQETGLPCNGYIHINKKCSAAFRKVFNVSKIEKRAAEAEGMFTFFSLCAGLALET